MKQLALLVALLPALAVARPLRNAYLDYRVTSVTGLVAEVKKDHAVADRYMRHFGMTKQDLIAMFSGLHVAKMTENRSVLMFGVPDDGIIHSHPDVLHKGLLVFADLNGEPVLKMDCGNPVVVHIKGDLDTPGMVAGNLVSPPPEIMTAITPPPEEIISLAQNPETPLDETTTILTSTNEPVETPSVIIPPVFAAAGLPGWLVGVPLLFIPFVPHHSPPPSTPEPVSMVVFAAGAGALALKKRRQNRV